MVFDSTNICNTKLSLGLGCCNTISNDLQNHSLQFNGDDGQEIKKKSSSSSTTSKFDHECSFPSLTLALPSDHQTLNMEDAKGTHDHQSSTTNTNGVQQASSGSAVSSFSNSSVKREIREVSGDQEIIEEERILSPKIDDQDQDEEGPRKKLRLTKEQSLVLEDSFKEHSTLNPKQKQALANKLNLRPRQVEVWFQNRRARTKLKQTEVDCEILKRCCETLKEENKRLHKELQELKAMKLASPAQFYMQLPAATLTMCPSCERISASGGGGGAAAAGGGENSSKISFSIGSKPHFYNPFTNPPSAAC